LQRWFEGAGAEGGFGGFGGFGGGGEWDGRYGEGVAAEENVAGFRVELFVGAQDGGVDAVCHLAAGGEAFEGVWGSEEVRVDVGAELGGEDVEEGCCC
jgi:hypothetical protein